jgi:hypothetical protein
MRTARANAGHAKHGRPVPGRQWFALVAPPVLWSAEELLSTYVAYAMCRHGNPWGARLGILSMAAVALPFSAVAATSAYWSLKELRGGEHVAGSEGGSRDEMLAMAALWLGVIFTIAITWNALPVLVLSNVCEARE